jgi:hypothetical protein
MDVVGAVSAAVDAVNTRVVDGIGVLVVASAPMELVVGKTLDVSINVVVVVVSIPSKTLVVSGNNTGVVETKACVVVNGASETNVSLLCMSHRPTG